MSTPEEARVRALTARIREQLREQADPTRAPGMQQYMKSEMPFLGVGVPATRGIALAVASTATLPATLRATALTLWDGAEHREERYAAMGLLRVRAVRGDPDNVPLVEHMVRTGQWWDITDDLAGRVAELHEEHAADAAELVRRWARDPDLWIRRIAILSQLGRRDRLDAQVLTDVVEPNLADPEFFIRKAIGWALREYARVAPEWVLEFVANHELAPLSRREALTRLPRTVSSQGP